jgi:multiple sugar transport system ATP-binding protein
VIVGIRPEAFALTGDAASAIGLTAKMVENSGSDTFATFELMGKRIIARLPGKARIESGQKVMLGVDTETICYFDPATEQRIG